MKEQNSMTDCKRAVIYCRVSTKEQVDEGNSLSTQEKICREYALKNGYDIAEVFIEQGESAKNAERTELRRLLSYCTDKKNKVSVVIAYKIDRLSRNTDDYSQIRILLKSKGVEIKSTTEFFENSPAGRFMENIIANVAQFDNDVRAERSINGMRDAMREGRYVWMAPVGYDNIQVASKCTIAPNPVMGPIMRKTFEMVALNRQSIEEVRQLMTKEGLANRTGKPLSKSYFYTMLKNEVYAGWIIKFGERHKGLFEPLVSQDTFDQVQRVLKYRTRKNTHYIWENSDFPLRRFVFHPEGRRLTGSWSTGRNQKYPYYRFGFKGTNYNRDEFESAVMALMNCYQLNSQGFGKFKKYLKENLTGATAKELRDSELLKKQIEELKLKQTALIQKNLEGVINNQILQQQLEMIERELMSLNAIMASVPNTNISLANIDDLLDYVAVFMEDPGMAWEKAKFALQVKLQWFQFPKGITFDGKKFGTKEICNLFKVKEAFFNPLSSVVPLRIVSWNHNNNLTYHSKETKKNKQSEPLKFPKEFWDSVANEVVTISEIMKEMEAESKDESP